MISDFSAARLHLDRACDFLCGSDETSIKARQALDPIIETVVIEQFKQQNIPVKVLRFPTRG